MLFLLSKLPRRPVAHPFRGEAFHNICDTLLLFLLVSLCDLCVLLSVNSVLPSLFLRLPDLPQYLRSRIPWHHLHAHNLSPRCFHFLASHNLISRPVLAFHQHIRQQRRNHALWRRFIKYQHRAHAFQVSEYFRALLRPEHRSPRPLQLSHAFIAVQSHNQHIAQRARRFQAFDVPRMQQIETPVGKHHAPAVAFLLPKPQNDFFKCQGRWMQRFTMPARPRCCRSLRKLSVYHALWRSRSRRRSLTLNTRKGSSQHQALCFSFSARPSLCIPRAALPCATTW